MSVVRGFGLNGKSIYMNICKPEIVRCSFVVKAADAGGLGITSLKSNGYVENVFMHTSQTPGKGTGGFLNPNPASGLAVIQFKSNFNVFLGMEWSMNPPVTGSSITTTVANTTYQITVLGTATLAQWQAVGLPVGFTPTIGQTFVATASQLIGGSGAVKASDVSNIVAVEPVGLPSTLVANNNVGSNAGAQLIVQLLGATNSSTTTLIPTAPTDGSTVYMGFLYDGSSVTIDGL